MIRGRSGGLFQSSGGGAVRTILAYAEGSVKTLVRRGGRNYWLYVCRSFLNLPVKTAYTCTVPNYANVADYAKCFVAAAMRPYVKLR